MNNVFIPANELTVEELNDLFDKMLKLSRYDPAFRKLAVEVKKIESLKQKKLSYFQIIEELWIDGYISADAYRLIIMQAKEDARLLLKAIFEGND